MLTWYSVVGLGWVANKSLRPTCLPLVLLSAPGLPCTGITHELTLSSPALLSGAGTELQLTHHVRSLPAELPPQHLPQPSFPPVSRINKFLQPLFPSYVIITSDNKAVRQPEVWNGILEGLPHPSAVYHRPNCYTFYKSAQTHHFLLGQNGQTQSNPHMPHNLGPGLLR